MKKRHPDKTTFLPSNRIKELRERRIPRMTAAALARAVHTSQAQISRLENGERELTEDWMRRIAKVLDVEPADLLEIAAFVNFRNEVEPYIGTIGPGISGALLASELLILRIVGSELEHLGLCSGTEAVFNVSKTAIGQIKTGDVVLIEITRKADGEAIRVPRQFIAPGSLVTNKRGRNIVFGFDEPRFDIAIVGVLVQPQT